MDQHRFILEIYKGPNTRYRCPACQKTEKTFSLYIDKETGEHLNSAVGRCNRESNCGHHYTPKQYFQDNNISVDLPQHLVRWKPKTILPEKSNTSFIPVERFKETISGYEENNFVKYLSALFGDEVAGQLIASYYVGSSTYKFRNSEFPNYLSEHGASIFWQIDSAGKVRTGKIMLYNPATGKRVKQPFNHITWAHKGLKVTSFELKQCFFGEHLLAEDVRKPVAIVESEKTALIASVYLPDFIWLAAGSLTNLNAEKCHVLKGRAVVLFPDLNGFEKWTLKAKELSHLANVTVSDLLEQKATEAERQQGLDLADYLIRYDYKGFLIEQKKPEEPAVKIIKNSIQLSPPVPIIAEKDQPDQSTEKRQINHNYAALNDNKTIINSILEDEVAEIETYFQAAEIPEGPVLLDTCTTIIDVKAFLVTHLATIKANKGNKTYLPYLARLKELKQLI